MRAGVGPCVTAGAALAASLVAVTPVAPRPSEIPVVSLATRLVDADSILNVPVNLLEDFLNSPYYEDQGLFTLASSLFFTGNWWVASSTNIWGIDPGDTTHVAAVIDLLFPNPSLADPEILQLDGLLAAELPANAACDAESCLPLVPVQPITGITGLDRDIWAAEILSGKPFPLIDNWLQVPFTGPDSLATGYSFGSVTDPSGPAYGFTDPYSTDPLTEYFPGTTGPDNLMPWADTTFTLDPTAQYTSFFDSLLADPSGIQVASVQDLGLALQSVLAGLVVDFDPFVPGSPVCPGACDSADLLGFTQVNLVQDILALDPNNLLIQEWLNDVANGTANGPTAEQVAISMQDLQAGLFTLNPSTMDQIDSLLADINPVLPSIAADSGLLAPYNPQDLSTDIIQLLGLGPESADVNDLLTNLNLDATQLAATLSTEVNESLTDLGLTQFAADLSADLSTVSGDLNTLSTDFTAALSTFLDALPAELAATLPAGTAATMASDLATTLSADIAATTVPDLPSTLPIDISSLLLSMF
jgi:hypothetical protein